VRWVQQRGSTQYDAAGIPRRTLGVVQDITERKLAEAALRESEERFRVLTALSSDYYWEQDEELRFKVITRANLEDTPAPESTAIGKRRWEVESLRAPAAAWRAHRRTLLERKPFRDFIVERYLLDGSIRQHAVSGVPVFALDGTFQGYRGVARDVTERERSRTQFRELRDRFERLANSINEVFYFIDQEPRRIHYINPAFENIYGLSLEALYADPDLWLKTIHVEDRRDVEQQFQGWLSQRGSSPFEAEYRIVRPDGEVRWMHDRAVRVGASPGGALQISGIAEDITSRKHAELVLRESEEKFRLLAENLREVVWISDPGLKHLLYVGPSFAEVWGAPLEAATADPVRWQLRVHPEDLPRVRQALRNQEQGQPAEVEFRITRPDGQLRWLSVRSSPMTDSHGQRLVCGVTEDVTHRVLEHARRLEQAIRQRDTLVREVHHRIKNSLQGVAGLLRSHAQRDRRAAPLFEVAIGQIQSIATVHGLQSMGSGGGAGIDDVVEAVARMVEGLTHKRIDLERSGVTDRRFVLAEGEAVAVALILNEIIVNAVKHCMSCGRGAEITASIVSRGDTMEVAVRNAGTLPKGFDLGSRAGLGTGLGLVCALPPTKGVALNISSEAGQVESVLTFREPVIQRTTAQ
jgi:PAS domain S-box-containing protein